MLLEATAEFLLEELAKSAFTNARKRWRVRRRATSLTAEQIAKDLGYLRDTEFDRLSTDHWDLAASTADGMVRVAGPIDSAVVLEADTDPDVVLRLVRDRGADVLRRAELDPDTTAATVAILAELCHRSVQATVTDPRFISRALRETLSQLKEIRQWVTGRAAAPGDFQSRYLAQVAWSYDRFTPYGLDLLPGARPQSVVGMFVPLAAFRADRNASPLSTGAEEPVETVLREHSRLVLRGGAGSGKSTLLRRYVVGLALSERQWASPAPRLVPFVIELRRCIDALPGPEDFVSSTARVLVDGAPQGWVDGVLDEGRGVVLVDGLDEIPPWARDGVRQWLSELCLAYPSSRFVLTTRHSTVTADWLDDTEFVSYDLRPMATGGIYSFVSQWHDAYLDALRVGRKDADEYERRLDRLQSAIERRPELRSLAATPLLCGLMCLVNHHRNVRLPSQRAKLYEEVLALLLEKWDERKSDQPDEAVHTPPLDPEQVRVLLERLAHGLVVDERDDLDTDRACANIAAETRGMGTRPRDGSGSDAAREWSHEVLVWLLERSSVLREPVPGTIEFSHASIRDYLAAREFIHKEQIEYLVKHAHQVRWQDVVVMAMTFATPRLRVALLRALLAGNEESARNPDVAHRLEFVAAACLHESPDVLDQDTGDEIRERLMRMLKGRVPPRSEQDAELLGNAGEIVLDLIEPADVAPVHHPFLVRALAMIGTTRALIKLRQLVSSNGAAGAAGLLSGWHVAPDRAEYARTVLADVQFGEERVPIGERECIPALTYLTGARVISSVGRGDPLPYVNEMPGVVALRIYRNDDVKSLDPLRDNKTLRTLEFHACERLRDVGAVATTQIEELTIAGSAWVRLEDLSGASLRRLSISMALRAKLPAELPRLTHLKIGGEPARRDITPIVRWQGIIELSLRADLAPGEVDILCMLPALHRVRIEHDAGRPPLLEGVERLRRRGTVVDLVSDRGEDR